MALFFVPGTALAQDVVKVSPGTAKVLLENDRVRVLEARIKPGEKEPMHSHPANLSYTLSDYKIKFTSPDGKTEVHERKAGTAVWKEAVTHTLENVGTTEAHFVQIELKGAATPGPAVAPDPVKVAPNIYKVLLENDRVRVLESRYKPGYKGPMHSHPAGLRYFLSGGKTKFTYPDGKTEVSEVKAGTASWGEAVTHAAENVGTTELHVMLIELKGAATPAKK